MAHWRGGSGDDVSDQHCTVVRLLACLGYGKLARVVQGCAVAPAVSQSDVARRIGPGSEGAAVLGVFRMYLAPGPAVFVGSQGESSVALDGYTVLGYSFEGRPAKDRPIARVGSLRSARTKRLVPFRRSLRRAGMFLGHVRHGAGLLCSHG